VNLICAKCGEILMGGKEHASEADCMASMKQLLAAIRKVFSVGAFNVTRCRARKHGGKKVIAQLDVCMHCLASGYSAYQVGHEVMTTGRIPAPQTREGRNV